MKFLRVKGRSLVCFSAKEIANLLISKFFTQLLSNEELRDEPHDSKNVSDYIKRLSDQSTDSKDYEYYTAILELYELFEKKCEFCFDLIDTFNIQVDKITTIEDIYIYRKDPPDVIVLYKEKFYEFELKRYRDDFNLDKLLNFLKRKVLQHYSGKQNFLVILQLKPYSNIDVNIFRQLHKKLKFEKNQPGVIGFSININNKEMLLIRILPDFHISKRPYTGVNSFGEILHSE